MHVPSLVPLQSPWSTVGYQVVEVTDPRAPTPVAAPAPLPEPLLFPPSPVGYAVVSAEETAPRPTVLIKRRARKPAPPARKTNPYIVWGSVGAGAFGILTLMLILAIVRAGDDEPGHGPLRAIFAAPRGRHVLVPDVGMVKVPKDVAVEKPVAPVKQVEKPREVVAVDAALPALPAAPFCDKDGCKIERPAARPGTENFGTAVEFARNPLEAARAAGEERKLTFMLHVSGNFEEARFT